VDCFRIGDYLPRMTPDTGVESIWNRRTRHPDVLVRLARAAISDGKMPDQLPVTPPAYRQIAEVLEQLGKQDEVRV
jgi:hypothetical protein